jgi:hypothetical protein
MAHLIGFENHKEQMVFILLEDVKEQIAVINSIDSRVRVRVSFLDNSNPLATHFVLA